MPWAVSSLIRAGEHAGSEAGKTGFKVLEASRGMEEEISEDEDGPAVADDVEGAGDGAAHGVFSGHGKVLQRNQKLMKPYRKPRSVWGAHPSGAKVFA